MKDVAIIIPAFNEAGSVRGTVDALHEAYPDAEIIVVDDGSTDATSASLAGSAARVLRHGRNRGYGASLKTGFRATSRAVFVMFDADGQHDVKDIARLVDGLAEAEMVIGQRTARLHSSLWRMPGKWMLGRLANYLSRTRIPDLNSGLRAVRREVALRFLDICPNGFSLSSTLTVAALAEGHEVRWLPIQVRPRGKDSRSTVTVKTGFDTILLMLRLTTLFEPLRVFLPISVLLFLGGTSWGLPYALQHKGVSIGALLLLISGMLTFFFGLLTDQNALLRRRQP